MRLRDAVMHWLRNAIDSEAGSAIAETALMFPIFVALLLGAVEFGDLAYKADEVVNAARSAAQYAAMNGGGYTDCNGTVPGSTLTSCLTGGVYDTAKNDAAYVVKSCSSFTVQETTSCSCSDTTACSSSSSAGYTCGSGRPIILVSVVTTAQCSPAANVPNLFPTGTKLTLNGFAKQEVLY